MNLSRPSFWATRTLISWILFPVSLFFRLITWIRKLSYRKKLFSSWNSPVPIIVVGNISVGGAGKTPLVIALSTILTQRNLKVGIVTSGYGGSAVVLPTVVESHSDAALVGDEAVLLARRSNVPVVACANRVDAVKHLLLLGQLDCVICDDGMQHYALHRDLEIAVVDSEYLFGNGFCLPAGPLRETVSRLKSVDMVVHSGADRKVRGYELQGAELHSLQDESTTCSIESFKGMSVHAVAGIASPSRFFRSLTAQGLQVIEHPFADHAKYQASDFHFEDDLPVVMTEKDMVKCREFNIDNSWFVSVTAVLDASVIEEFNIKIDNILSEKSNAR